MVKVPGVIVTVDLGEFGVEFAAEARVVAEAPRALVLMAGLGRVG